jgi:antagonist of KipI
MRIIKSGLLDTVQDQGRYGYQHLGINPNGVMDIVAMRMANALVGNDEREAVLEMHWPAPVIQFEEDTCFAISGASVMAHINKEYNVGINKTIFAKAGSQLSFQKKQKGARIYLAIQGGFQLTPWLYSNSTQMQVGCGGAVLKAGDILHAKKDYIPSFSETKEANWYIQSPIDFTDNLIHFTVGKEWPLLNKSLQQVFLESDYQIDNNSNRMGYRLNGTPILLPEKIELVSTAVTRGTIQLLPSGQPLVLMADHQTTGGYPRIGHVISADMPKLAQLEPGANIRFKEISIPEAHSRLRALNLHLKQMEIACKLRM